MARRMKSRTEVELNWIDEPKEDTPRLAVTRERVAESAGRWEAAERGGEVL